jgi:hypothetical protein
MRIFTFLLALLVYSNAMAVAPYGFKGQNQSTTLYSNVLQAPNNQVTNLGGINALMETGNKNILSNPSFEHSTFSTSWTNSAGTFTKESTVVIDGKASAKLVLSAQTMSLTQSSTLYQAQFADGVQGLASVRVKSDVALKVCSIQAGVVSTTNCVDVKTDNKWGFYKVPFILGGTSNGISIASNGGSVTGTVYIDDAFVGPTDIFQNSSACQTADCTTQFSARITSAGVITTENIDFLSGCTKPSTGTYKCNFNASVFTVAPVCVANRVIPGTTLWSSNETIATIGDVSTSSVYILQTSATQFTSEMNFTCMKQGIDFTTAQQKSNGGTYSSTNADTDWTDFTDVSAGTLITSTGGSPAYGTVAVNKAQWKRQGSDLLVKWDYRQSTAGSSGSGIYLFNIPTETGCTIDTTKAPGNTSTTIVDMNSRLGTMSASFSTGNAAGGVYVYDSTKLKVGLTTVTTGSSSNAGMWGSIYPFSTAVVTFNLEARVPCLNWQNSNIIIGQFNGLESCASTLDCTDTFSAKITSTGAVSGENVEWLNGPCTVATSSFTCPINSGIFTQEPNCTITVDSSANGVAIKSSGASSSQLAYQTTSGAGGSNTPYAVEVICQKQGADYVGKTAKAVASDQSLRIPGVTNYVTYMASLECDSASQILHQDGNWISSIGNIVSGQCSVVMNASKFANANYRCSWGTTVSQSNGATGQISTVRMLNASKTTSGFNLVAFYNSGGTTVANTDFTVDMICTGQAP